MPTFRFFLLSLMLANSSDAILSQPAAQPKTKATAKPKSPPEAKPTGNPMAKPVAKVAKPSAAQERAAEAAFKAGAALMEAKKFREAVTEFQKVLQVFPNESNTLWNAGSAAFFSQDFKLAAEFFERGAKQEPRNGHLLAKLVQTYQALGDVPRRDARRAGVFALHRSGKDTTDYTKKATYCRDQFTVNGLEIIALESFELRPRIQQDGQALFGARYLFYVAPPGAAEPSMRVEVGWNLLEPNGKGGFRPAPDQSAFYFDAYYRTGDYSRKTFGLFSQEMPYEVVKARLLDILNEKVAMSSGRKRETTGPGD